MASNGEKKIYLPSSLRADRFANGIDARLNRKLDTYTLPSRVEVKRGDVVCDVGAHLGEFTLAVADLAGEVFAFEPDPLAFKSLKKNVKSHKNVTAVQKLLWKNNERLEFKLCPEYADSSVFDVDSGLIRDVITVEGVRLDVELSKMGIEKLDFLKIEAEGAEPEVIEGTSSILESVKKLAVNCGPERYGRKPTKEVSKLLEPYDFNICVEPSMVFAWH